MKHLVISTLLIMGISLSACVRTEETQGYRVNLIDPAKLQVGKSNQMDVMRELGSPSITSQFGEPTWYYTGTTMLKATVADHLVSNHRVLEVKFTEEGVVSSIKEYTEDDIVAIKTSSDFTPTEGKSLTIMEQFLGNVGKFNPGGADAAN